MGEVEANILSFVVVDVYRDFLDQVERLAVGGLEALQISGENVVSLAGGNTLSKFAHVIGVELPTHFVRLIAAFADFHDDAVHGPVIRSPNRSGD